jgi:hypothetical protein
LDRGAASMSELNSKNVSLSVSFYFEISTRQNFSYLLRNTMICNALPSLYSLVKRSQEYEYEGEQSWKQHQEVDD